MTFPILGGNSAVGGYAIDNSLRFNDDDSPYLSRTQGTGGNRKTWTFSCWVKLSEIATNTNFIFSASDDGSSNTEFKIQNHELVVDFWNGSSSSYRIDSSNLLRDASAFYHLVLRVDTTQSTSADRVRMYINGTQVTSFNTNTVGSQNFDTDLNNGGTIRIGADARSPADYWDGYMTEVCMIEGQSLAPTSFAEADEDSGIWKPIDVSGLTFGTNGFYLDFENSGSLGADQSGNGNNFTPTNLTSTDQMIDTPTRNFCTMNPLDRLNIGGANSEQVTSEGNLKVTGTGAEGRSIGSTFAITPNGISKAYAEWYSVSGSTSKDLFYSNNINGYIANDDATAGNIVMMAVDCVAGKYWFGNNGTWDASGDPANGTNPTGTFTANSDVQFGHRCYDSSRSQVVNFGQDSTFAGNTTRQSNTDSNGEGDFYYTPPTGFLSLNSSNLSTEASPTIDDGSQYFGTLLWTGTNSSNSVTGLGFQPDFVWGKARSIAYDHRLIDSTRGTDKLLYSSSTSAEATSSTHLTSFDSDGITLGTANGLNQSGHTFVAWNWKANGGTTSSNTDGSITSTVQANTTAGFSIITYTGTGASATVGHGLGVAPKMIICKNRDNGTENWATFHQDIGATKYIYLDSTGASATSSAVWNDTAPTSSVFSIGNSGLVNQSSANILAYCFAEIEGYSKFGKYTGNGSTDGTFVYTGFRPAFVLLKRYQNGPFSSTDGLWVLHDSTRNPSNDGTMNDLYANVSDAEDTTNANDIDILSNGFKARASNNNVNYSTGLYIYLAFAENPFVSSTGIPVTAR